MSNDFSRDHGADVTTLSRAHYRPRFAKAQGAATESTPLVCRAPVLSGHQYSHRTPVDFNEYQVR